MKRLIAVVCLFAAGVALGGMSEYVPVDWAGVDHAAQVKNLRWLHDEYGFRKFVLIGIFRVEQERTTTVEDYAKFGESIAWARKELSDLKDVELGWWMAPTLRMKTAAKVQKITNSDGTPSGANCPLCPVFTAEAKAKVKAVLEKGHPSIVFFEDDYTLSNNGGQTRMKGCFCPLHLKEFAKRAGKEYSGAEIADFYDKPTDANRHLREAFAFVCRDSLATFAGEIRKTIDEVDPSIRTCLCQSGCVDFDGDFTEKVSRAFAGKTRPMVRICGAAYMNESQPAAVTWTVPHAVWSAQTLPEDFELIHETDPYPHTRFYASTYFLGSELAAVLMAGADGTYYYCSTYTDEPLEDDGYAAWMRANRPRLEAVRELRRTMKPCGVKAAYDPAEVYLNRGNTPHGYFGGLMAAGHFLGKMGFPFIASGEAAATLLCGETAEVMSDGEIRKLLSGGVLVDGAAAVILTRRGFADLIGCEAEPMPAEVGFDHEETLPVSGCKAKGRQMFTMREAKQGDGKPMNIAQMTLLKPLAGTEVWSHYVTIEGKETAAGTLYYENNLGGRIGVMPVSPAFGYGFNGGTMQFRKQELIHRLMAKLSGGTIDVTAPRTPSTWLFAAKNDRELLVMVENLCGEPRNDVDLQFSAAWQGGRIEHLDERGLWVDDGMIRGAYRVPERWYYPMKAEFFKVTKPAATAAESSPNRITETYLPKEMKAGYPKIRKLGATSPYGEMSPFVFKGKLMRLELIDPTRGLNAGSEAIKAGIRDVASGKIISTFGGDCYYYSAYVEGDKVLVTGTERQHGGYSGDTILAFESTDLVHWTKRVLLRNPGWRYFNTSLTRGPDGYILLMEAAAPRYASRNFTMFFAKSRDLKDWTLFDYDVCFPKDRYAGGPFIRWHNGYYYVSLVTEMPNERYCTYLYRTKDFRGWECGKYNPLLICSPEDREVSPSANEVPPELAKDVKSRFICSASDLEFCDFDGKTYLNYTIGDQHGFYYMCEAWYDGPSGELLEGFFK